MGDRVGARALRRETGLLWEQLLADLRRRLAEGEFTASFPGELSLVEEYRVSRQTVREALRRLRAEGLVTAARGKRPRVVEPVEIEQPLGALYSLFASVEATGMEQCSVVRVLDVRTNAPVAARLGRTGSTRLVYLERLRLAGGAPLAVDHVWLPEALAAPLLEVDFTRTALYDEYARRCGVVASGGTEHIRAVLPTPAQRTLLEIDEGVAAFAIDRLGCAGARPVEWRHTVVRGDRFGLSASFSARTGYRLGEGA